MKNKGFTWLCHHEILLEWCDDYKGRVAYIKKEKPTGEIETRLKWFRFVKGKLPVEVVKAGAAYDKARAAYDNAIRDNLSAIEALYREECPGSPWNGHTLFP